MKKSSIILSLLTLTATLVSLPALGELTYLKKNTPYIEKVPIEKITSLVSNEHAKIENLLDDNKNTEWISWQENQILTENYSGYRSFSDIAVDQLGTTSTTGNGVLKVAAVANEDREWRQYRLFESLNLSKDIKYSLRLRYRGNIAASNAVRVFLGQYKKDVDENQNGCIRLLNVPTEWTETEIEFDNLPVDIIENAGFCSMQPGHYPGILEVDWAVLSYFDENTQTIPILSYDYSTESKPTGLNSDYLNIIDGVLIASYNGINSDNWFQFDATPAFSLKPNTTYSIKVNIKGGDTKTSVQCWIGNTAWPPLVIASDKSLSYNNTDFAYSTITFTTPTADKIDPNELDAEGNIKNVVLRIQPGYDRDIIEIKNVEIYEYTTLRNGGAAVIPNWDSNTAKYTKNGDDGIIYSYPLEARRKVIVAHSEDLKYTENNKYAVTYKLKYSVDGTVKTEFHNTDGTNATVAGESDEINIKSGISHNVRSSLVVNETTSSSQAGAVVLDLGYNVGDIEVSDLKVYDITTDISAKESATTKHVNEAGPINLNGNMTTQLVKVMNDLTLHNDETYTVTVKLKATKAGSLCMKLGRAFPEEGTRRVVNQNFNGPGENASVSGWQLLTFTAAPANNDNGTTLDYNGDGMLALQLQDQARNDAYDGDVTIQVVKITSNRWIDGKEVASINYADVSEYSFGTFRNGASEYPKVEGGKLIIDDYWETLSDGRENRNIKIPVATGLGTIDQARTYKIYLTAKGSVNTSLRSLFGSDGANAVQDAIPVNNYESTTEAIYNSNGQYFTIANNSALQLQTQGTNGRIEISNLRVVQNANEQAVWFTNGEGTATGLAPNGNLYTNYKITNEGLVLTPQYNTKTIVEGINLTWGKQYPVNFEINAPAGDYVVTLGDDNSNESHEISITADEVKDDNYVAKSVLFGAVPPTTSGKLTITPQQYAQTISIQNLTISERTQPITAGDMIGTDFFTVELAEGYTMNKDGKYVFHIGYVQSGNDAVECTPKTFLIQGSTNGTDFKNIGTCEVSSRNKGNAYASTVDTPLKNITEGMKYLRFYCMDNEGEDYTTAICFPTETDKTNKTNAYVGNMMRMTRFAIYRQGEITDPQGSEPDADTWALPLLTRFQIEANGQQYAYPGARLRDMVGIHKGYSNTAELFGMDPTYRTAGYWDTTLPYNIQTARRVIKKDANGNNVYDNEGITPVKAEGGMNRDYADDGIDHVTSPYDCIDLLLPHLEDLRAASNKIYVSMAQAKGTIANTYPAYRTYDNNVDARFLDKSNGFPTEIMYQGFKYKEDGTKDMQGEPIVMNLITHPESELTSVMDGSKTNNFNVANFALNIGADWDGVRIWCRENEGDLERIHGEKSFGLLPAPEAGRYHDVYMEHIFSTTVEQNTRMMRFAAIQAYVEIPKINLEPKDDGTEPYPYHLLYNSRENFKNYTWNHTQGIMAPINNDGYVPAGVNWQDVVTQTDLKEDLEKHDIALPNFDFYASPFDDPYVTVTAKDGYTENGQRQRTYTILHEVQVLPGERVDLYPQSDIWKTYADILRREYSNGTGINYEEQFVRWYDYLTDDAPDYLYFFSEPKSVIKTENAGFIGGKTLLDHEQRGMGTIASVYFKQSDLNAFNNSGKENDKYFKKVNGETRLKDQWVAADFSLSFNRNLAKRLGKNETTWAETSETIDEPIVTFRHLFHLVSGKSFADENMADTEGNRKYYQNNRRYLTSFGDKDFMIRLEEDMPEGDNTKSGYYYKAGDGDVYRRIRGFEIKTYEADKYNETALTYDGAQITAGALRGMDMIKPIERSKFNHISTDIQTTVLESRWLENGMSFYRAIGCDAGKAKPGTYLVRIYGKDTEGKIITLPGKGDYPNPEPLVIAEYYVTFLDPAKYEASFESEETLKGMDTTKSKEENEQNAKNYYTHTENYLEGHFNKDGKSSLVVNFDNYAYLKDPKFSKYEFFGENKASVETDEVGADGKKITKLQEGSYLKLPIAWDDSNYGFGYADRGDYNMFVLGDHSVITPYMNAARAFDNYEGTYDRKYYSTEDHQKGLFYYVNAASDPGDMAKIQFGELCPGSTIYVSAWVNEFNNGQEETANVIFNFYANISDKEDPTHKIIRQDQIHGFVTGYIYRGTRQDSGNYLDGDQGKWMHVYYTFVPDLDRAQYSTDEEVLSYTLVLENNCISSSGADYAIDDIRAYVVEPRVEARQSTPVCNRNYPNDIEVEVMIPFASLYESMKESIVGDKMQLQYSVMDKQVYDKYREDHKGETEVNVDAFVESVLHYAHENIQMSAETDTNKPLSWGTIEFFANFKDYFELENGQIKKDSDGNPIAKTNINIGSEGQIIDEEEMLVFKTKLNTQGGYSDLNKDHRDYYIVIGNLGATGLFKEEYKKDTGEDLPEGKYNADVYPSKKDGEKYVKADWGEYDKRLGQLYQFNSKCVRISDFTLKGASDIIVDGIVYNDVDNITCCENQRPVVQIDLYKMKGENDREIITDTPDPDNKLRANPYIDWYYGSYEDFMNKGMTDGTSLWQVLTIFRKEYPEATTWDVALKGDYTEAVKTYLKGMCEPLEEEVTNATTGVKKTVTRPAKVQLHTSSFIFPTLTLKDDFGQPLKDAQGHILTSRDEYVTAIPDSNIEKDETETPWGVICTEPTEIKITVSNTSPEMLNGFGSGITYPADMNVVPLRSGLVHLDKTGIQGSEWKLDEYTTTKKDEKPIDISLYENQETLVIPLRNLAIATQGVTKFKRINGDPYCYLAETNDPNYRQLGQVMYVRPMSASTGSGETGADTPATQAETDAAGLYDSEFGLTPRGVITLDAETATDHFSNVKITFNKTDMVFREGYYYTFKFAYEEDYSTKGVQKPAIKEDEPCKGQTLFTIKVVPEYQVWTGNASLNWNNDKNWRRVASKSDDSTEITLLGAGNGKVAGKGDDLRFTKNGDNDNTFAYAPLDFTKVIIPAGATYPQLAARAHDRKGTGGSVSVKNGHGAAAVGYVWAAAQADDPDSNAPKAAKADGNESTADATYDSTGKQLTPSYLPTKYVQYDMAAVMYPVANSNTYEANVYCRPWYANACEQIHFNSNAEILNQQNLDYQKAWVDMDMKPDQWYNVASPLYGVVAGDMYLPTQGARQATELFTDITFDTTIHDRFHPAVYQRGWDKGSETVYNIEYKGEGETMPGCPHVETVALASTWSHVYNDVTEWYAPGMGVSVKTDVSRFDEPSATATNPKPDYVKFRFPKADTNYDYYSDKNESNRENGTSVNRDDKHQLYNFKNNGVVTLTKATIRKAEGSEESEPTLFLVGNPFMAHLDMATFLKKNEGVIEPKYWILSEGEGQVGVVLDHDKETVMLTNETLTSGVNMTATSAATGKLAPMQGFFVQAKEGQVQETDKKYTLGITFTTDMMAVEAYTDASGNPLIKAPAHLTRAADDDIISVSTGESTAIIRLSASADKGYAASEDVEMIDDSNQRGMRRIYTVAGKMAAAINQTPDADGVEVGLMAPTDSVTTVTFSGAALDDYLLYDTATGEMTQLHDGFELEMRGSVSGRYFLTSGIDTAEIEDGTIRIMPARHEVVVTAPAVCGDLTVRVYDTLGREIAKAEGFAEEVRIALEQGIYVIDAEGSEKGHRTAKVSLR